MKAGFRPSLKGTAGILSGNAIYFCLSALGLGALLLTSARVFLAIKWMGIAYLLFIGLRMLVARDQQWAKSESRLSAHGSIRPFSQGLLTQLSNPKAIIFFTALLPQFVSLRGGVFWQFLVLGLVSIAVEFPVLLSYGWIAGRSNKLFPARFPALPERLAGVFLIGAAVGLATTRRP